MENISKEFAASILSASDSDPEDRICTVSAMTHKLHRNHATFVVLTEAMLKIQVLRRVIPDVAWIAVSCCADQEIQECLLTYLLHEAESFLRS
jgi:hypothetical protein